MVMKRLLLPSLSNEVCGREAFSQKIEENKNSHQRIISHLYLAAPDRNVLYSCLAAVRKIIKHNTRMQQGEKK